MPQPLLIATDLTKSYPRADFRTASNEFVSGSEASSVAVLRGVSLTIARGEIVAIVGASGAGKSTLLHLLGALDTPDSGTIALDASVRNARETSPSQPASIAQKPLQYSLLGNDELAALRNTHIGFIFQFHHLLPEFTALENVMMPALIAGTPEPQARQSAQTLLAQVGLATPAADRTAHKPDALSGGEQQRVAFARALVNNPAIVFADEPTGNLDPANSEQIFALMQTVRREQQRTFVVITHSMDIARAADRIITLHEGRVQQ
jgi:lipoprotein-releasing system ATP-binding protein